MVKLPLKSAVEEWLRYPDGSFDVLERFGSIMAELTDLEMRLFEWIRQSDFENIAWSTPKAAKSFGITQNEIYETIASLTKKVPTKIQVFYKDGNLHIAAD